MLYVPTELAALMNSALAMASGDVIMHHGLLMLGAAFLGSLGCVISYYFASRLCAFVGRDIRMAIYNKSLDFAASDFEQFGTGSMITRTLGDINVIQQTLLMSIIMIVPVPIMSIIAVLLAFSVDTVMGWLLAAVTLTCIVITVVAVSYSAPIFTRLQTFVDRMNMRLREIITGTRVIRAFGKEADARKRLGDTFSDYADNAIRVTMIFCTADSLTFFLMNSIEAVVYWLGANRVGVGAMEIGSITALVEYAMLIMFFMMMAQFALLNVPRAIACLNRAGAVLAIDPEITDVAKPALLADQTGEASDEIACFDHVSFRFNDADEDTLHDLSFSLKRGTTTAIIGNTGSGKSTIAKMLLRFHDVTAGGLSIEGVDIRQLSQEDLRAHIAYVPQKAWLFSGTIAENLRYGAPHATDEQLQHALDIAQANFVAELPDGINSRVAQGGTNFSGGQRQRLSIARALARKAELYIFDDSFSALDYKTDATLRHALKGELDDAAVLIIAQRVSTIHDADQIVVLKDGVVVGLGRHEELLRGCPTYKEIAESQERGGK